jgi:hypothetical protein
MTSSIADCFHLSVQICAVVRCTRVRRVRVEEKQRFHLREVKAPEKNAAAHSLPSKGRDMKTSIVRSVESDERIHGTE